MLILRMLHALKANLTVVFPRSNGNKITTHIFPRIALTGALERG